MTIFFIFILFIYLVHSHIFCNSMIKKNKDREKVNNLIYMNRKRFFIVSSIRLNSAGGVLKKINNVDTSDEQAKLTCLDINLFHNV